jgi:hypothetical protein
MITRNSSIGRYPGQVDFQLGSLLLNLVLFLAYQITLNILMRAAFITTILH